MQKFFKNLLFGWIVCNLLLLIESLACQIGKWKKFKNWILKIFPNKQDLIKSRDLFVALPPPSSTLWSNHVLKMKLSCEIISALKMRLPSNWPNASALEVMCCSWMFLQAKMPPRAGAHNRFGSNSREAGPFVFSQHWKGDLVDHYCHPSLFIWNSRHPRGKQLPSSHCILFIALALFLHRFQVFISPFATLPLSTATDYSLRVSLRVDSWEGASGKIFKNPMSKNKEPILK